MKICFLEGDMSRRGGTERMTAVLANALSQRHTVSVVSLKMKENDVFFSLAPKVKHIVLKASAGKTGMLRQIAEIRRLLKKERIDTVINVDVGMGIFGILASIGTKTKVITWEHANYFNNWDSRVFPYFRRLAAKHSDAMVVLTKRDKDNYNKHIPSKVPVYVIPNPAAQTDFLYDGVSKTILSAGLLLPIKGYDRVIEVGKKIFKAHPDWRWEICGDGPEREALQNAVSAAGLNENIFLIGTVTDMESHYRRASMFVMTSHMEGLPMVLLEAKAYGLPLVSFDIMTGPSDIIRDGVNGYLIVEDDTDSMADKILSLIEDEALRRSFSAKSQLDMERFNMNTVVDEWENLLKEI